MSRIYRNTKTCDSVEIDSIIWLDRLAKFFIVITLLHFYLALFHLLSQQIFNINTKTRHANLNFAQKITLSRFLRRRIPKHSLHAHPEDPNRRTEQNTLRHQDTISLLFTTLALCIFLEVMFSVSYFKNY